jgi:hypothetical protein
MYSLYNKINAVSSFSRELNKWFGLSLEQIGVMRNLLYLLTAMFSLIIFLACGNGTDGEEKPRKDGFSDSPKNKEDSLFHEVMNGHDIGMARMGRVSKYLARIQHALDSINKLPETKIDADYQQSLIDLQEDLNYAEYGMNTWMDGFKIDSAKGDMEKRIQYLQGEKEKVMKVKEAILGALQRADSIFIKK